MLLPTSQATKFILPLGVLVQQYVWSAIQFWLFSFSIQIQRPMGAGADFIVQYNMVDISTSVTNIDDTFSNTDIRVTRTAEDTVLSVFPNGVAVSVGVSGDIPNIVVSLPQDFRGETRGLMGNFNGDDTDDLIFFNGTMLSSDASEREIFDFGQSCKLLFEGCKIIDFDIIAGYTVYQHQKLVAVVISYFIIIIVVFFYRANYRSRKLV